MAVEIPQTISDAGNIVLSDDVNASALVEYDVKHSDVTIDGNGTYKVALSKQVTFRTAKDVLYAIGGGSTIGVGPAAWRTSILAFGFGGAPLLSAAPAYFSCYSDLSSSGSTIIAIGGASISVTFPYTTTLQLLFFGSSAGGTYARLRNCWMETRMFRR